MNPNGTGQVQLTSAGRNVDPDWQPVPASVPEPASLLLLTSGLFGLGLWRTRKKR